MKAVCRICGKDFEKRGSAVTCSVECSMVNRHNHYSRYNKDKLVKGVIANCKVCGNEFVKKGSTVCCSDECRHINKNKVNYIHVKRYVKSKQSVKKGICKICGKEFFKNGSQSKCCSDGCRLMNKRKREYIKSRRKELKRQQQRIKDKKCSVCGKLFKGNGNEYFCSSDCRILHRKRQKSLERVSKRFAGMDIDKTVTLDSLIKRDNNICYICGEVCDSNDFTIINGYTICGNKYPSIDHVIPASKGGTHTWDNVKLAHRICNSYKCDSLYKENKEGQMEMFV